MLVDDSAYDRHRLLPVLRESLALRILLGRLCPAYQASVQTANRPKIKQTIK